MVLGDFNCISGDVERTGGQLRPLAAMEDLNNYINNYGMVELNAIGGCISWSNGHESQNRK